MRNIKTLLAGIVISALVLTMAACSTNSTPENTQTQTGTQGSQTTETDQGSTEQTGTTTSSQDIDIAFSARDLEVGYEESEAVNIALNGDSATVSGSGAVYSDGVISITKEGTYVISGTLTNGRINVAAGSEEKVQLVLNNASITCNTFSPIYIASGDKVFITLIGTSTLTDGAEYTFPTDDTAVDAVIFSRADLTLNGSGSLTINANKNHAICSKDDLVVTGGTYNITAVGGGLYGKDCVKIANGSFTITAGKDAIQSDNSEDAGRGFVYIKDGTFALTAETDGVQAQTVLWIDGGSFTITTGGGSANASTKSDGAQNPGWGSWGGGRGGRQDASSAAASSTTTTESDTASAKGLKSTNELIINGGGFTLDTSDDSLHTNGALTIDGGTLTITSGDDGIHADTTLVVNNGTINITKSYEGIESADITINGGTIDLVSSDDGFNAAGGADSSSTSGRPGQGMFSSSSGTMTLAGGNVTVNAAGDGLDSNGSITMTGGTYIVYGPTDNGNGAMDYDSTFLCNGGTLIALGSTGMAQGTSSGSTNANLFVKISGTANSTLKVTDSDGNTVCEVTSPKAYGCALIAAPQLVSGDAYTIYLNGTSLGTQKASK